MTTDEEWKGFLSREACMCVKKSRTSICFKEIFLENFSISGLVMQKVKYETTKIDVHNK